MDSLTVKELDLTGLRALVQLALSLPNGTVREANKPFPVGQVAFITVGTTLTQRGDLRRVAGTEPLRSQRYVLTTREKLRLTPMALARSGCSIS